MSTHPLIFRPSGEGSAFRVLSDFMMFAPAGAERFFQKLGSPMTESDAAVPSLSPELFRDLLQQYGVQLVEES